MYKLTNFNYTIYTHNHIYVHNTQVYNYGNEMNEKNYTLLPEKQPMCIKNRIVDDLKKDFVLSIVRSAGKHSVGTGVTYETE